jgi:hypothetical protein
MHAMDADELAALRWLHGRDRGRIETVYLRRATRNEAPFAQPGDVKLGQAIGMAPGLAALIRLLRGAQPLSADIRHALAGALEPVGVSEMKLVLELKRRNGRGRPRKDVEAAYDAVKLTNKIDAGRAKGTKQEAVIAGEPGSRSKKFSQMRVVRKVRERNNPPI